MGEFQSRPRGAKASKRDESEDIRAPRMLKAITDALHALAQATAERKIVALFNTSEMRDTPKAVASLSSCACSQADGEARVRSGPTRYFIFTSGDSCRLYNPAGRVTRDDDPHCLDFAGRLRWAAGGWRKRSRGRGDHTLHTRADFYLDAACAVGAGAGSRRGGGAGLYAGGGGTERAPPACSDVTTALTMSSPAAAIAGSSAASRGRRLLSTKQAKAGVALAAASKTLADRNDGI